MKNKDDYEIKKQKCRKQKSDAKTGIANFKDKLALAIKSATIEGIVDGITLAKMLQMIKNKTKYLNIRAWPQESVLPEEIEFEWKKMTSNWASAILIFLDSNHYEKRSERSFLNNLQPFIFYLTVYLPVYFQFNTDSDAVYPRRVDDLVGGYFISIPVTLPDKNLPLPYVEFVKAWHHGNNQYRRYDSIRALHQFFDEILKRKELLGIEDHYANPVMKSGQDNGVDNAYKGSIATDSEGKRITPHATSTIVVSEWCQILPHELVGRHITGQRPETVAYYNQNDADEMKKIRAAQKSHLQKINRDKSKLDLELDPVCIEAADKNAALVKGFNQDAKQAIIDFGGICSNFFIGDNGLDVVTKRRKIKLSFDSTHICPFDHVCPEERMRKGYANRHNFCDYAIRTVDHLPAIECTYRDLEDELENLEMFMGKNKSKLSSIKCKEAEAKRKAISEDMVGLQLAKLVLLNNLKTLKTND